MSNTTYVTNSTDPQRMYKWVYTVKYSSLILSIGLHVRGSNQLLESRKGGGEWVFHCTQGLMDCTITAAHNSTSDLSGVLSVKTQPESGFCLKIWQSAQEISFGVNLPRKCQFVKFRAKSIQNFCDQLVRRVTNWYCCRYWLKYWKLNNSELTVNTMDYIMLTLWSASSMILRDCEGSINNMWFFSTIATGTKDHHSGVWSRHDLQYKYWYASGETQSPAY